MEVEKFRGYVAAIVAAAAVVGGAIGAAVVWIEATRITPTPETAFIMSVFTGLIGAGSTFLFMADSASRASHAAERSFTSGAITGAQLPEQTTTLAPLSAASGAVEPPIAEPLDDAEVPTSP